MSLYTELYDFAASAGSFEGYVYKNDHMDAGYLPKWSANLVKQYHALPEDVRNDIQSMCDQTLGRAMLSLIPAVGEDHEAVKNLKNIVKGRIPQSPDDFDKH